ncbi:MAG: DNA adenine methylase [Bacteroidetes bacterium]|nr:DNA adenine methylase [Bacteroidota bacterium]
MYLDTLHTEDKSFELNEPLPKFPTTRFQGSKRKILQEISNLVDTLSCESVVDLYSGSGIVSLLFRYMGKVVTSNDFLLYNANTARLLLTEDFQSIDLNIARKDLHFLLNDAPLDGPCLVQKHYSGIYFLDNENLEIDRFCQNIEQFESNKSLYIYAVGQALIKKRPYNLFHRANLAMRTKEVERSFGNAITWETSILDHAIKCISELKKFPLRNTQNSAKNSTMCVNTKDLSSFNKEVDLVYLDPPYINGKGLSVDYSDFYNFLEGLVDYNLYTTGDCDYPHKPINKKRSAWLDKNTAAYELQQICKYWDKSAIILSYRSDGIPTPDEIMNIMSIDGRKAELHSAGEYQYALSKNKQNEEIFIVSRPKN